MAETLKNRVFVALDLETTGKYPLNAEICELAMVKFSADEGVMDHWESLIKPEGSMSETSYKIHGISEEDLKESPRIEDVLSEVVDFIGEASLVGHNLPFDLGFGVYELERFGFDPLKTLAPVNFCTSLISIGLNPKRSSHRLKDLAESFALTESPNHRAMQDTLTCMKVFLKLIEGVKSLEDLLRLQGCDLQPQDFSVKTLMQNSDLRSMVEACEKKQDFELVYSKGSKKNKWRALSPEGLVLKQQKQGFLVARDIGETQTKRFLIDKIKTTRL